MKKQLTAEETAKPFAFKPLRQLVEQWRREWLTHVRIEIQLLTRRGSPVTLEEWTELRLNSWEQEELYPCLDDKAFLHVVRHTMNNCAAPKHSRPYAVYDDALRGLFVPQLLDRFEKLLKLHDQPGETESQSPE